MKPQEPTDKISGNSTADTDQKPSFEGFDIPQKNYFHMPNEWINMCADINSLAVLKVVQYVLRHTWGYQEYDGTPKMITTDEFMHGRKRKDGTRIDKGTGLSNKSVIDGLKTAVNGGILVCTKDDSDKARINKAYALKMRKNAQQTDETPSDVKNLHIQDSTNFGCEESTHPDVKNLHSGVKNLHSYCEESSYRTKKDTVETHLQKETLERHSFTHTLASASGAEPISSSSLSKKTNDPFIKEEELEECDWDTIYAFLNEEEPSHLQESPCLEDTLEEKIVSPQTYELAPAPKPAAAATSPKKKKGKSGFTETEQAVLDRWDALDICPVNRADRVVKNYAQYLANMIDKSIVTFDDLERVYRHLESDPFWSDKLTFPIFGKQFGIVIKTVRKGSSSSTTRTKTLKDGYVEPEPERPYQDEQGRDLLYMQDGRVIPYDLPTIEQWLTETLQRIDAEPDYHQRWWPLQDKTYLEMMRDTLLKIAV